MAAVENVEVVAIADEYAVLRFENDSEVEIDLIYLPSNIKIGTVLRLTIAPIVVPHTRGWSDYGVG